MQPALRITLVASSPVPTYTGGPFVSGVFSGTTGAAAAGWSREYIVSLGSVGERVDIATGGNYAQLLDTDFTLSNHDGWLGAFEDAGGALVGAVVEVGTISGTTFSAMWSGTVADALMDGAAVNCRAESILAKRHGIIPARVVSAQEFPGLAVGDDGQAVPIVYGAVERMAPPSISSESNQLNALAISDGTSVRYVASTWIPVYAGVPVITSTTIPVAYAICPAGGTMPAGEVIGKIISGKNVFVEIVGGTGSGQRRRIISGYILPFRISPGNGYDISAFVADVSPWDTTPDSTSTIKCISDESIVSLAVADEASVSSVTAEIDGEEYAIGYSVATTNGVVFADVSSEFRNGEDYAAIEYRKPDNNYGVPELSDLVTATTARTVKGLSSGIMISGEAGRVFDAFCRGKIGYASIPTAAIDKLADLYIVASLDASALPSDSDLSGPMSVYPQIIVRAFDGTVHTPQMWSADGETPGASAVSFVSFNAFPPAVASDGTAGAFSAYAWKMPDIGIPLSEVESIEYALGISARPLGSVGNAINQVKATVTVGSNDLSVTLGTVPSIGDWIRPRIDGAGLFYAQGFANIGYQSGYWRRVTGVSGSTITVTDASAWSAGNYRFLVANAADLGDVLEREIGIAFVYGSIPPTTPFRVSTSAGRTYGAHWPALPAGKSNGDPITLARDAALDILYRDRGMVAAQVDFASFQALPADAITSAQTERIDSAQRLADLAQQFNWAIAHDASGRETASAWLSKVGGTTFDYTIDTGDMVEGSISGRDMTDVQDLVNQPRFEWDQTQADGFRQVSNVVRVDDPPSSLTASNYLQYLSGFGDYSTSLEVYRGLYASFQRNDYTRSGTFQLPDVGADASSVLWPMAGMDRISWMASRKPVLRFSLPETFTAGLPVVGRRAKVRHKRYTRNAWAYGTVVESAWEPMSEDALFAVTVMLDPSPLVASYLYEDVLDPTAAIEQYADQVDGVSTQYIDTLGAA